MRLPTDSGESKRDHPRTSEDKWDQHNWPNRYKKHKRHSTP